MLQNQPLQTQALQQQVQAGQLENQQRQIDLKDQEAMNAAMQQWGQPKAGGSSSQDTSMPNYDDLITLAKKNGASFKAIQGLQTQVLGMKEKASTIAKDDAQTGAAQANAIKTKNGMLIDAMSGVLSLPDDQLAPGLLSAAQELSAKGLLDPQHIQQAQRLAQSGDPAAIRKALNIQITGIGGFNKLLEDAQKQASIEAEKSTTAKNQAEADWYAKNGGAPGVPVEATQQADWLKNNPGKGPSDFLLWKLQHTPAAMIMGNQLGGAQNSDALDFAANNYRLSGQMPPDLARSPGTVTAVIRRAAEMDKNAGGTGIAGNKVDLEANKKSLDNLQKQFDSVNAFETTAGKNIDMALQKAAAIPDLGARFANIPVRMINEKMLGTQQMAEFRTAMATAQTEAAKVLNSSNASGVLSDSARHELEDITNGNLPLNAMKGQWSVIKQDMQNRHDSYQQQINDIHARIKGQSSGQPQPAATGGTVKMKAPNGQTKEVAPDQVDHYKQLGATVVQ